MSAICGINGRFRLLVSAVRQPVAGIKKWRRTERAETQNVVDFESPTTASGNPLASVCTGPVSIEYEVEGYFFTTPVTGVNFTSDLFGAGLAVDADYLFSKTGTVGIKSVTCVVVSVTMGQDVDGVATFSATLRQTSADPSPLVS